jgi:acyl carrier protein
MHAGVLRARALLAALLDDLGLVIARDAELLQRVADPDDAVGFGELGLDSLALLSLAIELDARHGVALAVEDLAACGDLAATADLVAGRG